MNKLNELRINCHKVLPLVYDDSLSYYEVLCKLTNVVNNIVEIINTDFESVFEEKADQYFNEVMIDAVYDESERTIYLKKVNIVDSCKHVVKNETLIIGEEK